MAQGLSINDSKLSLVSEREFQNNHHHSNYEVLSFSLLLSLFFFPYISILANAVCGSKDQDHSSVYFLVFECVCVSVCVHVCGVHVFVYFLKSIFLSPIPQIQI